jgi:hypothetical protein
MQITHLVDSFENWGLIRNLEAVSQALNQKGIKSELISLTAIPEALDFKGFSRVLSLGLDQKISQTHLQSLFLSIRDHFVTSPTVKLFAHSTWSRIVGLPAAGTAGIKERFSFEHGDNLERGWKTNLFALVGGVYAQKTLAFQFLYDEEVQASEKMTRIPYRFPLPIVTHPKKEFSERLTIGFLTEEYFKKDSLKAPSVVEGLMVLNDFSFVNWRPVAIRPNLEAMDNAIRNCDAFILTDPRGSSLLTAIWVSSLGPTMIVPRSSAMGRFFIGGESAAFYDPGDLESLKSEILRLRGDSSLRLALRAAALSDLRSCAESKEGPNPSPDNRTGHETGHELPDWQKIISG